MRLCFFWLVDAAKTVQYTVDKVVYNKPEDYCFTQGLVVFEDGVIGESCGLYEKSYIRTYQLVDNAVPPIIKNVKVSDDIFLEGIAVLGDYLWALTWREKKMLRFDRKTLEPRESLKWVNGDGWGLTTDGCVLFATNGGNTLFHLDAAGKTIKTVTIKRNGKNQDMLNDIMYVAPKLWINIWQTDEILRVDPYVGKVEKVLSLKDLNVAWDANNLNGRNTPNGIIYDASKDPHALYVTGKLWPDIFKLKLETEDLCGKKTCVSCKKAPPSPCLVVDDDEESCPTGGTDPDKDGGETKTGSDWWYSLFALVLIPIVGVGLWLKYSGKKEPDSTEKKKKKLTALE